MLFNSLEFIFVFLPVILLLFWVADKTAGATAGKIIIAAGSLVFYGWWKLDYLLVLLGSIFINFALSTTIQALRNDKGDNFPYVDLLLAVGICLNLGLLFYFKYTAFIIGIVFSISSVSDSFMGLALPLGISFFTFQQIAYLVEVRLGRVRGVSMLDYFVFIAFFPQLIAGPIVLQKEIIPQLRDRFRFFVTGHDIAVGSTLFALGLFKKTVIADNLAMLATPVFSAADMGQEIGALDAWTGSFAYTFQLYFDFSGYSDMAIGIARMFGIVLPLNFSSPYKAKSIIDFWKRWHLTLTRFLNVYIYNPIVIRNVRTRSAKGLDISSRAMQRPKAFWSILAAPTLVTMVLAGIWHGAGYQFLIFGLLHGFFLVVNHAWRVYLRYVAGPELKALTDTTLPSVLVTFVCIVLAFVFFRAGTVDGALNILKAGVGLSPVSSSAVGLDILWIAFAMAVTWLLPNSQEWNGI